MSGRNPSLAWALAAQAIAFKLGVAPLPHGTSEAEVGRWRLAINATSLDLTHKAEGKPDVELRPFEVYAEHLDYVAFGLLAPDGGVVGGYPEAQFIADMVAFLPPDALSPFADQLGAFKDATT